MTDRELMQQALDALEHCAPHQDLKNPYFVIEAIRARLAQPEPKPVAWIVHEDGVRGLRWSHPRSGMLKVEPLYASPPQREWQWLTEDEIDKILDSAGSKLSAILLVEAQLRGKNI